jgi:hypothetical protein
MVIKMGIIPCNSNCVYQNDGYCNLENVSKINNSEISQGCAHYISLEDKKGSDADPPQTVR